MFEDGYQRITNIDISKVVIDDMRTNTKVKSPGFSCKILLNFWIFLRFGHGRVQYAHMQRWPVHLFH